MALRFKKFRTAAIGNESCPLNGQRVWDMGKVRMGGYQMGLKVTLHICGLLFGPFCKGNFRPKMMTPVVENPPTW